MKKCVYMWGFFVVHLIPIGNEKWVAGYNIIYHQHSLFLLFSLKWKLWAEIFLSFYCWGQKKENNKTKFFSFPQFFSPIHEFELLSSGQLAAIDTIDRFLLTSQNQDSTECFLIYLTLQQNKIKGIKEIKEGKFSKEKRDKKSFCKIKWYFVR